MSSTVLADPDYYRLDFKELREDPAIGDWIGVRVEKVLTSFKGCTTKNFEVHIARVG
jgi:hypothetical protein